MPKLITFSCFMMFWVFYEMSGGADFEPRERVIVSQAPFAKPGTVRQPLDRPTNAALVTNAEFTPVETEVLPAAMPVAFAISAPALPSQDVVTTAVAEPAQPEVAPLDIVVVSGSRVNFRRGPGTNHAVLDTLAKGTKAELIGTNDNGWARIRLIDSAQMGWMAESMLSDG